MSKEEIVYALVRFTMFWFWWDELIKVAPLITALAAVFVGLIALRFNHWSTRSSARQDQIRMLTDIDSKLIERPSLWSIYDRSETMRKPVALRQGDAADGGELQKEAFVYMYLNMFEGVYDFDRHIGLHDTDESGGRPFEERWISRRQKVSDKEYKGAWEEFIKDFFKNCSLAPKIFQQSRRFYASGFVRYIEELCPQVTQYRSDNPVSATSNQKRALLDRVEDTNSRL